MTLLKPGFRTAIYNNDRSSFPPKTMRKRLKSLVFDVTVLRPVYTEKVNLIETIKLLEHVLNNLTLIKV